MTKREIELQAAKTNTRAKTLLRINEELKTIEPQNNEQDEPESS